MPKTRNEVARTVADAFIPVEQQSQELAAATARCIALLIEQRNIARLPAHVGVDALAKTTEGAQHLVAAANCFGLAHRELASIYEDIGLDGVGTACPPNEATLKPELKVVERAA